MLLKSYELVTGELITRMGWRENYLKLQLLSCAVIACLSLRIEVAGIKADLAHPELLLWLSPISVLLCLKYVIEDRVVGNLGSYVAELAKDPEFSPTPTLWDASPQYKAYAASVFPLKLTVSILAFVIVPACAFAGVWYFHRSLPEQIAALVASLTLPLVNCVLLLLSTSFRRKSIEQA